MDLHSPIKMLVKCFLVFFSWGESPQIDKLLTFATQAIGFFWLRLWANKKSEKKIGTTLFVTTESFESKHSLFNKILISSIFAVSNDIITLYKASPHYFSRSEKSFWQIPCWDLFFSRRNFDLLPNHPPLYLCQKFRKGDWKELPLINLFK